MTIKEAFQLLADATKKGMKNPFFIMRSLYNSFSDIAENVEEGGGGSTDIEYSTEEKKIGKWIDGTTDVYEKSYILNNITFSNSAVVIDNTLNKDNCLLIGIYGFIYTSAGVGTSLSGIAGIDEFSIGPYLGDSIEIYAGNAAATTHYNGGKIICIVRYLKITN